MKIRSHPARMYLAGVALAMAGVFASATQAAPGAGPMMMAQGPMGGLGGHGGMFEGMLMRLLERVNATPEQRTQIQQIMQNQASELRAQREAGRALRQQAMTLFAQPSVDAGALEALRQKQLALHDAASRRMTAAMVDISRVLSPEQRKQMAEYMAQRSEMMQRHRRERQGIDAPKS